MKKEIALNIPVNIDELKIRIEKEIDNFKI
jgi:hypothetical protein